MTSLEPNRLLTWCTSTQASSDEFGFSTSMRGKKIHDRNVEQKNHGLKLFALLALLTITCRLPIASSKCNLEGLKLDVNARRPSFEYVETQLGAVAADDSRCSKVGAYVLTRGGHAVDAAIATVLCVGVVNPTESGIGGGSFMVVRNASNSKIFAFNMRETAPRAAYEAMFSADESDFAGPRAAGVPGELKGLYEAWKMFGRCKWECVFQPAIKYARDGFEVYPYLAQYAEEYKNEILADPGLRSILSRNGKILKVYEICYNPKLADTLEAISKANPELLYNGRIGRDLIDDLRVKGGIMTTRDLRFYRVGRPNVIEVDFLGYKLVGMPSPSSGTIGLAMVSNILKNYGDVKNELEGPLGIHRLTEALKHVLAARMSLGDPNFVDITRVMKKMNSSSFGTDIWRKINDTTTFSAEYYQSSWRQLEDHGTSHQSIVDQDRNAVAITTSLNLHFGGKFMSPKTGIILNNQMGDFSFPKPRELGFRHPNRCQPGKRPLSSMTPLIIFKDEKFVGVVGGTGGRNIIASVTQTVLRHFAFELPPVLSVHNARVYPKLDKRDLEYEDVTSYTGERIVLSDETEKFLALRKHNMTTGKYLAYCHFIASSSAQGTKGHGFITAVSDIRKGSTPAAQLYPIEKFTADF